MSGRGEIAKSTNSRRWLQHPALAELHAGGNKESPPPIRCHSPPCVLLNSGAFPRSQLGPVEHAFDGDSWHGRGILGITGALYEAFDEAADSFPPAATIYHDHLPTEWLVS